MFDAPRNIPGDKGKRMTRDDVYILSIFILLYTIGFFIYIQHSREKRSIARLNKITLQDMENIIELENKIRRYDDKK